MRQIPKEIIEKARFFLKIFCRLQEVFYLFIPNCNTNPHNIERNLYVT
jgi:hypothetical protein